MVIRGRIPCNCDYVLTDMNVMRLMFFLCNMNFCRCLNWAYPNIISPCRIYNDENFTLMICIFGGFSYCGSLKVYHDYIYKTPGKEKSSGFYGT
jgi:hypothetical protein